MPGNFEGEDLRIVKTHNMLITALSKLLESQNFRQITINDLCVEALISRSTFYSHFKDKYDLLRYWLAKIESKMDNKEYEYEDLEKIVNYSIISNKKVIKNLIENANDETSKLFCDFILSFLKIDNDKLDESKMDPKIIVLSNVCCGGMLNYLLWQVDNKFPAELPVMNPVIYGLLQYYRKLGEDQKCSECDDLADEEQQL